MSGSSNPTASAGVAVVVGGGIGGLAAARGLQQSGWSVRVLEQAPTLEPLGAGITLWPNAVRALAALDVRLDLVRPERRGVATDGPAAGIRTRSGRWLTRTDPTSYLSRYGTPLVSLHRRDLHAALLASLRPDTLQTGTRVDDIDVQPDQVVVRHAHEDCHQNERSQNESIADLVVLADGMNSAHRHLVAGGNPAPRYAGYTAWRGVTQPEAEIPDIAAATGYWGRGERFGVVPLVDGSTYWFATANTIEGLRVGGGEHADVVQRFSGWPPVVQTVVQATDPASVLRHDVYDLRPPPKSYVRGRILLLGDAAHAMTPDLGQGACQALEDAAALGVLLRPGTDLDAALTAYDRLRRPRAQMIARQSRQIGRLGQLRGRVSTAARNTLLAAVPAAVSNRTLDATLAWQPPVAN